MDVVPRSRLSSLRRRRDLLEPTAKHLTGTLGFGCRLIGSCVHIEHGVPFVALCLISGSVGQSLCSGKKRFSRFSIFDVLSCMHFSLSSLLALSLFPRDTQVSDDTRRLLLPNSGSLPPQRASSGLDFHWFGSINKWLCSEEKTHFHVSMYFMFFCLHFSLPLCLLSRCSR